jgi:hypothetical protein
MLEIFKESQMHLPASRWSIKEEGSHHRNRSFAGVMRVEIVVGSYMH